MDNLTIMYHYIRDNTKLKAFSTKDFEKQIKWLLNHNFRIITVRELIEKKPKDKTACLTFDDGLKDGIINAVPIMDKYGVKGSFYIPTIILGASAYILPVHKRHLLLAKIGAKNFQKEWNKKVYRNSFYRINGNEYKNELDTELVSSIKYIVDLCYKDDYLDAIFNKYFNYETEFNKLYLTAEDINNLIKHGHDIGSHGYNHTYYERDTCFNMDMWSSFEDIKTRFKYRPLSIAYPFGSHNIVIDRCAKQKGFNKVLLTEQGMNVHPDNLKLFRFDCIDIGKEYYATNMVSKYTG